MRLPLSHRTKATPLAIEDKDGAKATRVGEEASDVDEAGTTPTSLQCPRTQQPKMSLPQHPEPML